MTELIWPPSLRVSSAEWSLIGNAGESRSPLNGVGQTIDRSGDRWKVTLNVENASDRATVAERSIAEAFLAAIRNKNNRVWVTPPGYAPRGSFSAPELFANADFTNGTTGWLQTNLALSVRDRVMRCAIGEVVAYPQLYQSSVAVTQYAPHILRAMFYAGNGLGATALGPALADSGGQAASYTMSRGLVSVSRVVASATATVFPLVVSPVSGYEVGHYLELPFTSLSRCALVDNAPNVLTQTNDFSHADWTKSGTAVTANYFTAPDGTTSADRIIEDTSTGEHYVLQSKTRVNEVADWCFAIALAPGDIGGLRNRAQLCIVDSGSTNAIIAQFDLLNGTISVAATAGGATANPRAFIKPMGLGYYYCAIVGQMPASDTTVRGVVNLIENPSTSSYTGASSRNIAAWRGTLAQSSVPVRLSDRTTAAPSGTSQTGSGVYLKGLPASTQNLARAGDWCQIGDQLFKVTSPLDGDAAGLGYLTVSPNVRTPFADNAPVIFNQPMAKMRLATEEMSWSLHPGGFGTFQLTFEESL